MPPGPLTARSCCSRPCHHRCRDRGACWAPRTLPLRCHPRCQSRHPHPSRQTRPRPSRRAQRTRCSRTPTRSASCTHSPGRLRPRERRSSAQQRSHRTECAPFRVVGIKLEHHVVLEVVVPYREDGVPLIGVIITVEGNQQVLASSTLRGVELDDVQPETLWPCARPGRSVGGKLLTASRARRPSNMRSR